MVIADLTLWTAAERGHAAGLRSLFNDLLLRSEIFAPGMVFAQLVAEAEDERQAKVYRQWAEQVEGNVAETAAGWTAAGDLHHLLDRRGMPVTLLDAYLLSLAIRESAPVWTFNPAIIDATRLLPVDVYEPPGVNVSA